MKNIEVELRSLIDESKFISLSKFLKKSGEFLGEDNKDTYFFLFPDKLLKVTNNTSTKTAKISLKLNRIGKGSDAKEIEIPISPNDVTKTLEAFKILGLPDVEYSYQFRNNYKYKDVEIAVKYTESWGFHVELEILVEEKKDAKNAKTKLIKLAKELDLQIATDEQLTELVSKVTKGYRRGKYTKEKFHSRLNEITNQLQ